MQISRCKPQIKFRSLYLVLQIKLTVKPKNKDENELEVQL